MKIHKLLNKLKLFSNKLSAGTLFSLMENLSLDVNYQYVTLGAFKSETRNVRVSDGAVDGPY